MIVYDHALVGQISETAFDASTCPDSARISSDTGGRGSTFFITVEERACVLRHYYRGGMVRHLTPDVFIWTGQPRTRSFSEWRLTAELHRRGFPVPRPVAARYVRRGPTYTADLITERIAGVTSFAARLRDGPVAIGVWRDVGAMIGRFHRAGVAHADLNAHNIQISSDDELYLLDFDRGRIMASRGGWAEQNLARLKRSLRKVTGNAEARFSADDWLGLLAGYAGTAGHSA